MKTFSVHEAKTHLSRLLVIVAEGEEVVITKSSKPVARLLPFDEQQGYVRASDDIDNPIPQEWFESS